MKSFASDNSSGIHPIVMKAIVQANNGHAMAYGGDDYAKEMDAIFKSVLGPEATVFPVPTGTAANILCLSCMTDSFHSVVCAEAAHVSVDECNALQKFTGCSLEKIPAPHGKLTPESLDKKLCLADDVHCPLPRVISITQATERGTIYEIDEIRRLSDFAHSRNMLLHMDGARLPAAAAAAGCSLAEMTTECGVDALSFGGTKNGAMMAEAAVFFRPELATLAARRRKQGMALVSKMRFMSAQFTALLKDELWRDIAKRSNAMAAALAAEIYKIDCLSVVYPPQANMVFVKFPAGIIDRAREKYYFHSTASDPDVGRLVTSFDTTMEDINNFISDLKTFI